MEAKSLTSTYELANGTRIPCVGFGTWQTPDGDIAYESVLAALRNGYRHIDTATAYGNEQGVGRAIRDFLAEGKVKRSELFVTTKLDKDGHGYEEAKAAIEKSLSVMGLDYFDLYLIHWLNPLCVRDHWAKANADAWRAMEEAYEDGKLKAIGLSNFFERHYEKLMETAKIPPMVDQIKICPGIPQNELVAYCKAHGMLVEGYSPMGTGGIFKSDLMQSLSAKYGRSISQICVRWSLQKGCIPLPKSVHEERIIENAKVFDFTLSDEDCRSIDAIDFAALGITAQRNPDENQF